MEKEDLIEFMGNVLIGITCPFLFLFSDNPQKVLFGDSIRKDDKDGNCK